jgi:hypothetical protein
LTIDNVSIEEGVSSGQNCHITYSGDEMIYAYYESGLTPITTGQSIDMSQLQNYNPSVGVGVDAIIVAALGEGVVDIVSPNGSMLSEQELSTLFDFTSLDINFTFGSGGHHYFDYVCYQSCEVSEYDLNNDGFVNDQDFEIFMDSFGVFCESSCESDFNQDGVIDVLDLGLFLENMNTSCVDSLSLSVNQFIQASFIPGVELGNHTYNYRLKIDTNKIGEFTFHFPKSIMVSSVLSTSRGDVLYDSNNQSVQINQRGEVPVTVYFDMVLDNSLCESTNSNFLKEYNLCL